MKLLSKIASSFKTRSFRVGTYTVAATIVVIAIAIVVNILAAALPSSWMEYDTSANQMFTLSEQTEQIVRSLDQEVTVYWIVRSGYEDIYLETLLGKYDALSDNLKVVQKDPDIYPAFAQQYEEDYTENSIIVECGSQFRYVDYYDIYVIDYYSYYYYGTESWEFYGEQELTSAIDFVIAEDLPKLYMLTGHGEASLSDTFTTAIDDENIETEELSLLTLEAVPDDADAILVYAPQRDISEEEKEKLEAYLAKGGQMIFLSDLVDEELVNFKALMASYGVTLEDGIVVEDDQNYYAYGRPYYLLPAIASHTITTPLKDGGYYVLLAPAQGMTVSEELPEGISVTELLTTSDKAFSKVAGYDLKTYEKEDGDIDGPFALAVAISDSNTGSNILWVSSSTLVDDSANTVVSGGNQDMFLNMVCYLCEPEGSSISIRAKSLDAETLTLTSQASSSWAVIMIAIVPLSYLAIGIVKWYRRKRK